MRFLPKNNLWDSVQVPEEVSVNSRRIFGLFCKHKKTLPFTWVDHRAGPGWMADIYAGQVCVQCRKITHKERIL